MLGIKGLATGIGSLPHLNPQEALETVLRHCPQIPFWPQLTRRSAAEGMVAQFSEGLPCLKLTDEGLAFDPQNKDAELERFYEKLLSKDPDYFKISEYAAAGLYAFKSRLRQDDKFRSSVRYIKCHITGPFTFAGGIKDERGVSLLHEPVFMQAIIEGLAQKALWQIRFFEEFGKSVIIFIDEPFLGCFGSAYTPINREDVVKGLSALTQSFVRRGKVLAGVHCCGNTDWSIFTDVTTIDIINFDAFGFLDKLTLYAKELSGFLGRGGALCWGIVPTFGSAGTEAPGELMEKIKQGVAAFSQKGLDEELLWRQLCISPACGLGTLTVERAEQALGLLSSTAALLEKTLENKNI